eukprot:jgi/Chrzof1/3135/Cz12g13050.t1
MAVDAQSEFDIVEDIANGNYGSVVKAVHKATGAVVAIKRIPREDLTESHRRQLLAELRNHKKLSLHHYPHVVGFKNVFLTPQHVNIVMEYANGGDLLNWANIRITNPHMPDPTEADIRWIFQQLVLAVDFCHISGVCNRDIKLENTLVQYDCAWGRPTIKICDFGFSKDPQYSSAPKSKVGTSVYMAPEVMQADDTHHYDGAIADSWSCGVVLYSLVKRTYPFIRSKSDREIVILQRKQNRDYGDIPNNVSAECKDLIHKLLDPNPRERLGIQGIKQHPWFLQDLPEQALLMNQAHLDAYNEHPLSQQAIDELETLVDQAIPRRPPHNFPDYDFEHELDGIDDFLHDPHADWDLPSIPSTGM